MSRHIRVLVVDDSLTVRSIFRSLLEQDGEIVVAGEVSTAEEALTLLPDLRPDVIAVDENLPGMDGLRFIDAVKAGGWTSGIVLVSSGSWSGAPLCGEAFEHGADACFDKSRMIQESDELVRLIKQTAANVLARLHPHGTGTILPGHALAA